MSPFFPCPFKRKEKKKKKREEEKEKEKEKEKDRELHDGQVVQVGWVGRAG
eukprot:CAMPEP_0201510018 /NCGR_PEP_ID=MMETSP0161_2-20130828/2886_1 /ASSEMBLY_ACC=CAM_ASM_000251 /TAXON_ID=180227 /ORGANISM="Neoparamoeba aestuarina, Strain SoJaBio B1-5/56/2" /LENGTH=50 /DNA_ID=CAMNT_0047905131 /DNA_START=68 /DNA_END=220 /DNA_ORIENTATION=+